MEVKQFLINIDLQEIVKEKVLNLISVNKNEYFKYVDDLCDINIAEKTYQMLCEKYQDDTDFYNILAIYILAAINIYPKYKEIGIDDIIYFDTMKVFKRFMDECYLKHSRYFFDRSFWTYRQTSMVLFRIGTLEYEFLEVEGTKKISIHIPSDAILTKENIEHSIEQLSIFIEKYYPDYSNSIIYCSSWLLSERLKEHLKENSRILLFQSYFDIIEFDSHNMDIYEWVFRSTKDVQFIDLPENTSLQRSIKKSLLNGRWIGKGTGILKKK